MPSSEECTDDIGYYGEIDIASHYAITRELSASGRPLDCCVTRAL